MGDLGQKLPEAPEPDLTINSEAALLAAVMRKDRKATAEFVSRYADAVYSFISYRLSPRYDAIDDLVQEVFLAAWENIDRYHGGGSLQAWLIGIARHKVEDYYRALLRAPEPLPEIEPGQDAPSETPDLDGWLDYEQLSGKIRQVMETLAEPYRLALFWRYWERASAREMAARTGKTEKAIERLLARAREQFRERWTRG